MPHPPDDLRLLADDPRTWLDRHVPEVAGVVSRVSARHRLAWPDQQDLLSVTLMHLTRDDYRVLRQFRGTAPVTAYLRVVVERQALDMRTARWGKRRLRRFVGLEEVATLSSPTPDPLATLMEAHRLRQRAAVWRHLAGALATLTADERRLLHARHAGGLTVSRMADATGADRKGLYRRFDRLYARLRVALAGAGVSASDARALAGGPT